MIRIEHVTKVFKRYNDQHRTIKSACLSFFRKKKSIVPLEAFSVVKDLNINIHESEVFCISGPNGAGKSTLAKLIAGTTAPTSGKVIFSGRVIPFLELGVAFNYELTGLDNLYLNGVLLGLSIKYLSQHKDEIFKFGEIESFMHTPLKYYSTGMQLRLAFSIARHAKGDIYIFDEILAVGDRDFQKKCKQFFKELLKKRKTIVIISHDLSFIKKHANRLLILRPGGEYELIDDKKKIQGIKYIA